MRVAAANALAQMGTDGQRHAWRVANLLQDNEPVVRQAAVLALGLLRDAGGAAQTEIHLRDTEADVRSSSADAFRAMADSGAKHAPAVAERLADPVQNVCLAATAALAHMGGGGATKAVEYLEHHEERVRRNAARALGVMGGAGAEAVAALLAHQNAGVRCAALAALGAMGEVAAPYAAVVASAAVGFPPPDSAGCRQERCAVRLEAVRALALLGDVAALPHAAAVRLLLRDREAGVRTAAVTLLARLVVLSSLHDFSGKSSSLGVPASVPPT